MDTPDCGEPLYLHILLVQRNIDIPKKRHYFAGYSCVAIDDPKYWYYNYGGLKPTTYPTVWGGGARTLNKTKECCS